jgi:hypothetical protein
LNYLQIRCQILRCQFEPSWRFSVFRMSPSHIRCDGATQSEPFAHIVSSLAHVHHFVTKVRRTRARVNDDPDVPVVFLDLEHDERDPTHRFPTRDALKVQFCLHTVIVWATDALPVRTSESEPPRTGDVQIDSVESTARIQRVVDAACDCTGKVRYVHCSGVNKQKGQDDSKNLP